MDFVYAAHSGLRYLVLLMGAVVFVHAAFGALRNQPYGRVAGILMRSFIGVLDLQFLLGVVLLFLRPFYGALIGHIVLMLGAVVVAHATSVINRRGPPEQRGRKVQLAGVTLALVLVIAGILAIGRGIFQSTI